MHFSKMQPTKDRKARFDTTFQTYDRKEGDQDCFSLLSEIFEVIPKKCPISIEVKDKECSELACQKMVEILRKYDRFETTVIGSDSNALNEMLLKMDSRVSLFCSTWDVVKILICYFSGLLPYLDIQREAF